MLADQLDMSHATIIMEVVVNEGTLRVKRELEGGWFQWIEMSLPALLTIQSGINQLRYATLKGIMSAKKKPVNTIKKELLMSSQQRILDLYVPEKEKTTQLISGDPIEAAAELVRVMREDVRVI